MPPKLATLIRRQALRVEQTRDRPVYLFALTGEELLKVAEISRISRDTAGRLLGYQRGAVKRHIRNIVEYLDSGDALFPNSLILAFSPEVRFRQRRTRSSADGNFSTVGTIEIPLSTNGHRKPAWIVDGQQRALALSMTHRRQFPVPVSGFIVDDLALQRDQFIRINSTKPLPRGLITELLPEIRTVLPKHLTTRRVASIICELLNTDPDSPLYGRIRRTSMAMTLSTRGKAVIADTALIQMLEHSIASPSGCLFPYRNLATGDVDVSGMRSLLFLYWGAVRNLFSEAWGLPPSRSRLMHGAGIRAMGRLMDRMMSTIDVHSRRARLIVVDGLSEIRPHCHWTSGSWSALGGLRWNEVQNLPTHIRRLAEFLVTTYLDQKDGRP